MSDDIKADDELLDEELKDEEPVEEDVKPAKDQTAKLKKEVIKWRLRAKANEDAEKRLHEESKLRIQDNEKVEKALFEVKKMQDTADRRLKDSELRSAASDLGLKKLEYLKLIDHSKIEIDESGNVSGVREQLQELKKSDPELFKMMTTTNSRFTDVETQKNNDLTTKKAVLNLSKADYEKSKRDLLRNSR